MGIYNIDKYGISYVAIKILFKNKLFLGSSTFGKLVLVFPSDTFPYIPGVFLGFVG